MAEPMKATAVAGGPSDDVLRRFQRRVKAAKETTDEARAALGQIYSEVEQSGINRPAFKLAVKLKDMDAVKAQTYLQDLMHYCAVFGVHDQASLDLGDDAKDQGVVVHLPSGAGVGRADRESAERGTFTFEVGKAAALEGQSASANPHPAKDPSHAQWNSGWLAGQKQRAKELGDGTAEGQEKKRKATKEAKKTKGRKSGAKRKGASAASLGV